MSFKSIHSSVEQGLALSMAFLLGAALLSPALAFAVPPGIGFPAPGPVEGADPANRHHETIEFPTELKVVRTANDIQVFVAATGMQPAEYTAGFKMIVALRKTWFMYPAREARPESPRELSWTYSGDLKDVSSGVTLDPKNKYEFPVTGKPYIVELKLTVFETDIPTQHMWSPESGKYKVLMEKALKVTVK